MKNAPVRARLRGSLKAWIVRVYCRGWISLRAAEWLIDRLGLRNA